MLTRTLVPNDIDLAFSARRAAAHVIKMRARHYARRPPALDALFPGLSIAAPATLIAVAAHIVEREARSTHRWFGFGGEVNLLNARAALLLGRVQRRADRRAGSAADVGGRTSPLPSARKALSPLGSEISGS